uniref:Uncharacterized protein n=1 Tax=Tanacetum cinerariifolium TaxID=118510 RepID=A0A6L2JHS8_TANCI|nr:hypothetical protein [Tanacetum cinerariifolium]
MMELGKEKDEGFKDDLNGEQFPLLPRVNASSKCANNDDSTMECKSESCENVVNNYVENDAAVEFVVETSLDCFDYFDLRLRSSTHAHLDVNQYFYNLPCIGAIDGLDGTERKYQGRCLEDVIRRDLHLDDADGVECLPNEEIFAELNRMSSVVPWHLLSSALLQVEKLTSPMDDLTSHNTRYTSPSLTPKVFANIRRVRKGFSRNETPLFASMLVQQQPQAAEEEEEEEVKEQPSSPHNFTMPLLTTLMETCASLSQKVAELEQDKHTQALEILKLKKRINKLENKKRSRHSGFKRLRKGRIDQEDVNAASKGVSVAELTVSDDKEVTMTMAHTLIKLKAEKVKLLDEQISQKMHNEEVQKAAARDKQEKDDLEKAQNMAGYKIEHFRGMTYDKVRPIFKREYKKVQTLFKPDKYVEEPKKKRVAEETLLQESFKKLKAVEVSGSESTQEITSNDPKEMSKEDVQNMLESPSV